MATSITVFQSSETTAIPPSCHKCGGKLSSAHYSEVHDAQRRIEELEAQVKILTLRATSAVERATNYEDALRKATISPSPSSIPQIFTSAPLRSPSSPRSVDLTTTTTLQPSSLYPPSTPADKPPTSRLARLLPTRTASVPPPSSASMNAHHSTAAARASSLYTNGHAISEVELLTALTREQTLRMAAESAAARTNDEIEELTGQLFEQANEMVAAERRARARLEERVEMLERRDGEKARRLEVLEGRVKRVERVRSLLEQTR